MTKDIEMVETRAFEPLNKLTIAIGKILGGKYTVHHSPGKHTSGSHNITAINNETRVGVFIEVPHNLVVVSGNDLALRTRLASIMSKEALRPISIEMEEPA